MTDLPIIIAFLAGALTGYFIGRSRRGTEFDLLQLDLYKARNQLDTIRRLDEAKEKNEHT